MIWTSKMNKEIVYSAKNILVARDVKYPFELVYSGKRQYTILSSLDELEISPLGKNKNYYVGVPQNQPVSLYADLEWNKECFPKSDCDIYKMIVSTLEERFEKMDIDFCTNDLRMLSASKGSKGSLHLHYPKIVFENVDEQKIFWDSIIKPEDFYYFEEKNSKIQRKCFIDPVVYNKNRLFRLPYCSKMEKNGNIAERPLKPKVFYLSETSFSYECKDLEEGCFLLSDYTICQIPANHIMVSPASYSFAKEENERDREDPRGVAEVVPQGDKSTRCEWDKDFISSILEKNKLEVEIMNIKDNLIILKNISKMRKCIINGEMNETDNAYLTIKNNKLFYHCFDEGCQGKKKLLFEFEEQAEELKDQFDQHYWMNNFFETVPGTSDEVEMKHRILCIQNFTKEFLKDVQKYWTFIISTKPFILIRQRDQEGRIYYNALALANFKDAHSAFTVPLGKNGVSISLANLYLSNPNKKQYQTYDSIPNGPHKDAYTFNTWTGFDITPEKAFMKKDTADIKVWLKFQDDIFGEYAKNINEFFAWILRYPERKHHFSPIFRGDEGIGKGINTQMIMKIIGPKYSYHCMRWDDVFGSFNAIIEGKIFISFDETSWGGDKKHSGELKAFITETTRTSNQKFLPSIKVRNDINSVQSSNSQHIVPAGKDARRFLCVECKDTFKNYKKHEREAIFNFPPEVFANYLYNIDLSQYDHTKAEKTEMLKEQKMFSMEPLHSFWLESIDKMSDDCEAKTKLGEAKTKLENVPVGDLISSNKDTIYNEYKEKYPKYAVNNVIFWKNTRKMFPTMIEKKETEINHYTQEKVRIRKVFFPPKSEMMGMLNKIYDCDLFV